MKRMQLYNGNSLDDFLHIKSILERNNIRFDTENTLSGEREGCWGIYWFLAVRRQVFRMNTGRILRFLLMSMNMIKPKD